MATTPPQAFTITADGRLREIQSNVVIRLSQIIPGVSAEEIHTTAIWDTGATHTVISETLARDHNFPATGRARVKGVHGGIKEVDTFTVDILLPNNVGILNHAVCSGGIDSGLLIGMDIITFGDFAVTNAGGKTVVSFRVPSQTTHIDYVKEINAKAAKSKSRRIDGQKRPRHGRKRRGR